jgi:predicted AlkP superfamily phosphohydrolase/phosphomutase
VDTKRPTTPDRKRVLILGLDGATFDLISPWAQQGLLPTFARLMSEGGWGPMRSILPPYSLGAWSTMVTGRNPGKHGVLDFWKRDFHSYGFRLQNASSRVGSCIWRILSERGRRVIVLNVPMTYPPEEVTGVMVSGMDTPGMDAPYTYPQALKSELEESIPGYMIMPSDWRYMRRNRPDLARAELLKEIEVRFAAAKYLLKTRPWDFAMVVSTATDGASHFFWKYHDPTHLLHDADEANEYGDTLLQVYQAVDGEMAKLLDELPDQTSVLLVSDHGNGAMGPVALHLNLWLHHEGLLAFRSGTAGGAISSLMMGAFKQTKEVLYDVLPFQQLEKLRRVFPDFLRQRTTARVFFPDMDWPRTKAYSEEFRGHVWINVRGRDPDGIVEPGAEYEAIRDRIIEGLSTLEDPRSGRRLLRRVCRREDLYSGPFVHGFPDLLLESDAAELFRPYKKQDRSVGPVRLTSREELREATTSGGHLLDGILVAWGGAIQKGRQTKGATLADVVPTALCMMGEPIPGDIDGRVLTELFEPSYLERNPPRWLPKEDDEGPADEEGEGGYSDEEAKRVKERLEGLGYLG